MKHSWCSPQSAELNKWRIDVKATPSLSYPSRGLVRGQLWVLGWCKTAVSVCLELGPPAPFSVLFQADIRDEEALYCAFEGVDCVFHMASYGMSGAEKVNPWCRPPGRNKERV